VIEMSVEPADEEVVYQRENPRSTNRVIGSDICHNREF